MSYLGYTNIMTAYCRSLQSPWILEIGIDRGQTTMPLLYNLSLTMGSKGEDFKYVGIDVRMDSCLFEQLSHSYGITPVGVANKTVYPQNSCS